MGIATLAAEAGVSFAEAVDPPDAGWHRVSKDGWDVLAHVNPDGAVGPRSHGHIDLGSFELAHRGRALVVDRGLAKRGTSAWDARVGASHSAINVDGYEPMLAWGVNGYPSAMDRGYWDPRARAETTSGRLEIVHQGFSRIARGCVSTRRITLGPRKAAVEDTLSNVDGRTIDVFVQLDPSLSAARDGDTVVLSGDGVSLRAAWSVEDGTVIGNEIESTSHSPEYGVEVPAQRLHLRVRGRQATRVTLTFETAAA